MSLNPLLKDKVQVQLVKIEFGYSVKFENHVLSEGVL